MAFYCKDRALKKDITWYLQKQSCSSKLPQGIIRGDRSGETQGCVALHTVSKDPAVLSLSMVSTAAKNKG